MDTDRVLQIARIALRLGEVERVPTHPDGRRETDTTHTVMLALLAADAAQEMGLNPGEAALYALVHDLPEAYAGDTDTSRELTPAERQAKKERESAASNRLQDELVGSMIADQLYFYELQGSDEAKLVHLLDKMCPKAVRIVGIEDAGHDRPLDTRPGQQAELRRECPGPAWEPLHQLADELRARLLGQGEVSRG